MSDVTVYFNKNRRVLCSAKESSVLSKRVDDAKRKQSIYSQKSLNCYAVEGSNMGPKHSKIIVFFTWVSWNVLSVAFLSLWIHLEKHNGVRRIPKRSLLFRWESIPLWGFLWFFEPSMPRKGGAFRYTPIATMYGQSHSRQSPLIFYWAPIFTTVQKI